MNNTNYWAHTTEETVNNCLNWTQFISILFFYQLKVIETHKISLELFM